MSTLNLPVGRPAAGARGPSRVRRVAALAGAETLLFVRNRTALVNSVVLPLMLVAFVPTLGTGGEGPLGPTLLLAAVGIVLVFLTYYNLVTTYVARREQLVLQRMRTGELTGTEVLIATAAPTLAVTVGQLAIVTLGVVAIGEWVAPVNAVLLLVAVVGGSVLMVLLALATTLFTRSPESAQITTLPVVVVTTALSGLFFPLTAFGDGVLAVARFLPVTPIVELVQLGLTGDTVEGTTIGAAATWGAAVQPVVVLLAWMVVAGVAHRRGFRWAPAR